MGERKTISVFDNKRCIYSLMLIYSCLFYTKRKDSSTNSLVRITHYQPNYSLIRPLKDQNLVTYDMEIRI